MIADAKTRLISNKAGDAAGEKATFKAGAVYDTLKRRILDGIHPPGDWLRLSQLARDFSLSEMPLREALRLLQKDGLVVLHRHRGAQVAKLSLARGYEIVETRLFLEKAAALAAVPFHTPASQRAMAASIRIWYCGSVLSSEPSNQPEIRPPMDVRATIPAAKETKTNKNTPTTVVIPMPATSPNRSRRSASEIGRATLVANRNA